VNRLAAWVAHETGGSLSTQLEGSTSSTLFDVLVDDQRTMVVRAFTDSEWLATEPDLAVHEAAVLRILEAVDLPTPRVVALDRAGETAGVPAIIMTRLPGRVNLPPSPTDDWLASLGTPLVILRDTPASNFTWTYDPWIDRTSLRPPDWSHRPSMWERAIARYFAGTADEPWCLLHRDYHPTNILWEQGRVSGIVDWVNACLGPPSSDIAHCRLNLTLMYGQDVADRFTDLLELPYDPVWDLAPALSVLPELDVYPPWTEFGLTNLTVDLIRRRIEEFVARAW
jgi:aminoglycoside phosphotransferase (APT) family kinase protein